MPQVILDGYNLLLGEGRGAGESDRDALVREAARYRQGRNLEVVVVFDSRHGGGETLTPLPGVRVEFARGEADAVILDRVRRSPAPREVLVVTSDRRLAAAARDLGARCEERERFRERAGRRRSGGGAGAAGEKPERPAPGEVDEWLERFRAPRRDGWSEE